jgi:hypothetical protein
MGLQGTAMPTGRGRTARLRRAGAAWTVEPARRRAEPTARRGMAPTASRAEPTARRAEPTAHRGMAPTARRAEPTAQRGTAPHPILRPTICPAPTAESQDLPGARPRRPLGRPTEAGRRDRSPRPRGGTPSRKQGRAAAVPLRAHPDGLPTGHSRRLPTGRSRRLPVGRSRRLPSVHPDDRPTGCSCHPPSVRRFRRPSVRLLLPGDPTTAGYAGLVTPVAATGGRRGRSTPALKQPLPKRASAACGNATSPVGGLRSDKRLTSTGRQRPWAARPPGKQPSPVRSRLSQRSALRGPRRAVGTAPCSGRSAWLPPSLCSRPPRPL